MNEKYFAVSPVNTDENNNAISYMTVEDGEHFTALPNDSGKPIIYFTQKKLAEKYIKMLTTDTKLYVSEIKQCDIHRLEWICCYDYNIPLIKLNSFWGFVLGGVSLSGTGALFIWIMEGMLSGTENTKIFVIKGIAGLCIFTLIFALVYSFIMEIFKIKKI